MGTIDAIAWMHLRAAQEELVTENAAGLDPCDAALDEVERKREDLRKAGGEACRTEAHAKADAASAKEREELNDLIVRATEEWDKAKDAILKEGLVICRQLAECSDRAVGALQDDVDCLHKAYDIYGAELAKRKDSENATVASLQDLGDVVDLDAAEACQLPQSPSSRRVRPTHDPCGADRPWNCSPKRSCCTATEQPEAARGGGSSRPPPPTRLVVVATARVPDRPGRTP
jgi:hypothetical protein